MIKLQVLHLLNLIELLTYLKYNEFWANGSVGSQWPSGFPKVATGIYAFTKEF